MPDAAPAVGGVAVATTGAAAPAAGAAPASSTSAGSAGTSAGVVLDRLALRAQARAAVVAGAARPAGAAAPVAAPSAPTAPAAGDATAPATPPASDADPLAASRRAEQHFRRQMAEARAGMQAEFDQQRTVWQRQVDEAAQLKQTLENGRNDPLKLLRAANISDGEFDALARLIYSESPQGKKDPRNAKDAAAVAEKRAYEAKIAELAGKVDGFLSEQSKTVEQRQAQARLDAYAESIAGAADAARTPLAHARIADPDVRAKLIEIADEIYMQSGPEGLRDVPAPQQVLGVYETRRAVELERLRPEYEALAKRMAAPAPAGPAGAPAPAGEMASTAEHHKPSRDELLEGIRRIRATT